MTKKREFLLIAVCWLSYIFAQVGRYSYGANVTLIMDKFSVEHAPAALPATLFFFAYGVGQVVVGLFCHKFSRKLLVVSALTVSGIINLVIFFGAEFFTIKYLWLLNGFVQANFWPVLLLILRENISFKKMAMVGIIMSTSSSGGKFAAIGLCAIFAIDTSTFMYCFLAAGILLFLGAALFFFAATGIKKTYKTEIEVVIQETPKQKIDKKDIILLVFLIELSLASYAIYGGLQSWIPAILKENYGLTDSLSIFMSVLLPLFTLSVAVISPYLNKKLNSYVLVAFLAFGVGAILISAVLLCLDTHWLIISLFTIVGISMDLVANTTTVQVPLTFKGKFDAGFLAGILNGACYMGMAIATYGLGYMADIIGWTGAFILLIVIAVFSALLAVIYLMIFRKKTVSGSQRDENACNYQ